MFVIAIAIIGAVEGAIFCALGISLWEHLDHGRCWLCDLNDRRK